MAKSVIKEREEYVPEISSIRFVPMTRKGSFVGYASLVYAGLLLKSISVHRRADGEGYRLDYPQDTEFKRKYITPTNKVIGDLIEQEVNCYLKANWEGKISKEWSK